MNKAILIRQLVLDPGITLLTGVITFILSGKIILYLSGLLAKVFLHLDTDIFSQVNEDLLASLKFVVPFFIISVYLPRLLIRVLKTRSISK